MRYARAILQNSYWRKRAEVVRNMINSLRRAVGVVALSVGFASGLPSATHSMTVSPLTAEMTVGGASSQTTVRVTNDSTKSLPVEVVVYKLELDEQGKITTTPAPNDFLVVPAQTMIPPGGSQTVRLRWAGQVDFRQSQSYVIAVNQLSVKTADTKSGVQLVFNFSVAVNVAPPGAHSELSLKNVAVKPDEKAIQRPVITVSNTGNRHASLGYATLVLTGEGFETKVTEAQFRETFGVGLVQPGKQRQFVLPIKLPPNTRNLKGRLEYQATKADAAR